MQYKRKRGTRREAPPAPSPERDKIMTEINTAEISADLAEVSVETEPATVEQASTEPAPAAVVETPATEPWMADKWDIRNCVLRPEAVEVTTQNWNRVGDMLHSHVTKAEGGKCITKFKNDRVLDRAGLEAEFAAEVAKQEQGLPRGRYFCVRCVIESKITATRPKAEVKVTAPAEVKGEAEVVDGVDLAQPFKSFEADEAEQDALDAAEKAKIEELKAAAKPAPVKRVRTPRGAAKAPAAK